MPLDMIDIAKIAITIASLVVLYLFRKKIVSTISDLIIGGDSKRYKDEPSSDIVRRSEARLNEVLK